MAIEANYHRMYEVSTEWTRKRLVQACKDGFVELAFGLRLRTPLLEQSILGTKRTLREAEAEARTAGNALSGQSYGLLNNRAAVAFMEKVWDSPYKHDILPVALIHDAIYLLIRDDLEVITWANKHLTEEMAWQELPELYHPTVKLGAELDLYYPSWATPITLPADASREDIYRIVKEAIN